MIQKGFNYSRYFMKCLDNKSAIFDKTIMI